VPHPRRGSGRIAGTESRSGLVAGVSEPPDRMVMRLSLSLPGFCRGDIGIDTGATTTVLCARGGDLVIVEPSVIAVDARTGSALAAGSDALEFLGRRGVGAIRPIADGAIVDLQRAAELLRHLIAKVQRNRRSRPRVVASVSTAMSALHRRAMIEACLAARAREVRLIAQPIAAALGCGLSVDEPIGSMVLCLGATMSEVAMVSMRAIVASQPIAAGGDDFDRRIVAHLRRTHQVRIGEHGVEHIKIQIGSPRPDTHDAHIEIVGRDLASGALTSLRLTSHEIRDLLDPPITRIVDATKDTLARTAPQLAADVLDRGITLTGENALLRSVAQRITLETGTPVHIADSARTCAAIGAAKSLEREAVRAQHAAPAPIPVATATSH
jgi:rod shape-determining protein MreB and related proteins